MKRPKFFKPPGFYTTITVSVLVIGIIALFAIYNPKFAGSLNISIGKEGGSISIQKQSQ
ncbi:MAG: hypothetical protein QNJ37_01960 [Crocosphaera sp.]|nr:hypothetical protein [Crocosphaera sp.]